MFVVFVVERRTMKFLSMKHYRIVPGCGLVYCDHEYFSTNWPKIHCSQKFPPPPPPPPKNTRYTVVSMAPGTLQHIPNSATSHFLDGILANIVHITQ